MITVIGFTLASALCGLAGALWQIVAARLLQGVFGAALVPLSQAVLLDINPRERVGQAMAIYGIARYLPETRPAAVRLDPFGFATLSLGVGALQLFLDRGEQLDWFNSIEIRAEAITSLLAFLFFSVHTWTSLGNSFLNKALLRDRNFVVGVMLAFIVGVILYATMALQPSLLQGLMNYPIVFTGLVMAPRGIGTMLAMMAVGRLLYYIDVRVIMAFGFALTAFSLYLSDFHIMMWLTLLAMPMLLLLRKSKAPAPG